MAAGTRRTRENSTPTPASSTFSGNTARPANVAAASLRLAAEIVPVTIWPAWSRAV